MLTTAPQPPTPIDTARVRRLVAEDAARSLQRVGAATAARYQFAHATLLEHAQADADLAHPVYRTRIHQWADTWRDAGWPTARTSDSLGTPRYLLGDYLTTLTDDLARQHQLAGDALWSVAAIHAHGVDRVLAELRPAARGPATQGPNAQIDDDSASASVMYQAIRAQAHHLRDPAAASDSAFAARQLCLHALELGQHTIAETLRTHLEALPEPGPIPLWSTRRVNRSLEFELTRNVGPIAVLPDGRIVTCSNLRDGRVQVWDPNWLGATPIEVGRHEGGAVAVAVLPDSRIVTCACAGPGPYAGSSNTINEFRAELGYGDGRLLIWDSTQPGAAPVELGHDEAGTTMVAVLPDGQIVTGSNSHSANGRTIGRLLVWDPYRPGTAPIELSRVEGSLERVTAVAVLPDGRIVTSSGMGTGGGQVLVWDPTRPGTTPIQIGRDGATVDTVAVLPDGRIVTGSFRVGYMRTGQVLVWDPTRPGTAPIEVGRDEFGVGTIAVLADGRFVTCGSGIGRPALVWDPTRPGTAPIEVGRDKGEEVLVSVVAALPDGRIVTGGGHLGRGRVLLWAPTPPGPAPFELNRDEGEVGAIAVLPDGRIVTGGQSGGQVLVWDPTLPGATPIEVGRHNGGVSAIAIRANGGIVTGGQSGGRVLVWDPILPGVTPIEVGRDEAGVSAIEVLTDGHIVTGSSKVVQSSPAYHHSEGRVLVWDLTRPGTAPIELRHDKTGVSAIVELPDGRIVTGSSRYGGDMQLLNPTRPRDAGIKLGFYSDGVAAIVALPDGRVVTGEAVVSGMGSNKGGRVLLWDPTRPGTEPVKLGHIKGRVGAIAVLPGGRLAIAGDGCLKIWNVSTPAHETSVACGAQIVVSSGSSDTPTVIVLHKDRRTLSGWTIPSGVPNN